MKGIPYGLGLGIGQCVYSPDGDYVVGVCYKSHPRKLGAQMATSRPSILFKLDFEGNYGNLCIEISGVQQFFWRNKPNYYGKNCPYY